MDSTTIYKIKKNLKEHKSYKYKTKWPFCLRKFFKNSWSCTKNVFTREVVFQPKLSTKTVFNKKRNIKPVYILKKPNIRYLSLIITQKLFKKRIFKTKKNTILTRKAFFRIVRTQLKIKKMAAHLAIIARHNFNKKKHCILKTVYNKSHLRLIKQPHHDKEYQKITDFLIVMASHPVYKKNNTSVLLSYIIFLIILFDIKINKKSIFVKENKQQKEVSYLIFNKFLIKQIQQKIVFWKKNHVLRNFYQKKQHINLQRKKKKNGLGNKRIGMSLSNKIKIKKQQVKKTSFIEKQLNKNNKVQKKLKKYITLAFFLKKKQQPKKNLCWIKNNNNLYIILYNTSKIVRFNERRFFVKKKWNRPKKIKMRYQKHLIPQCIVSNKLPKITNRGFGKVFNYNHLNFYYIQWKNWRKQAKIQQYKKHQPNNIKYNIGRLNKRAYWAVQRKIQGTPAKLKSRKLIINKEIFTLKKNTRSRNIKQYSNINIKYIKNNQRRYREKWIKKNILKKKQKSIQYFWLKKRNRWWLKKLIRATKANQKFWIKKRWSRWKFSLAFDKKNSIFTKKTGAKKKTRSFFFNRFLMFSLRKITSPLRKKGLKFLNKNQQIFLRKKKKKLNTETFISQRRNFKIGITLDWKFSAKWLYNEIIPYKNKVLYYTSLRVGRQTRTKNLKYLPKFWGLISQHPRLGRQTTGICGNKLTRNTNFIKRIIFKKIFTQFYAINYKKNLKKKLIATAKKYSFFSTYITNIINIFENRLDVLCFRSSFAKNQIQIRALIKHRYIEVNFKIKTTYGHKIYPGNFLTIHKTSRAFFFGYATTDKRFKRFSNIFRNAKTTTTKYNTLSIYILWIITNIAQMQGKAELFENALSFLENKKTQKKIQKKYKNNEEFKNIIKNSGLFVTKELHKVEQNKIKKIDKQKTINTFYRQALAKKKYLHINKQNNKLNLNIFKYFLEDLIKYTWEHEFINLLINNKYCFSFLITYNKNYDTLNFVENQNTRINYKHFNWFIKNIRN